MIRTRCVKTTQTRLRHGRFVFPGAVLLLWSCQAAATLSPMPETEAERAPTIERQAPSGAAIPGTEASGSTPTGETQAPPADWTPHTAITAEFKVDRERGEVLIPCRFVNPSRLLEVFACHNTGPAHETVVEFDESGKRICEALQEIGCRPAGSWNATSRGDFLQNQGDRVVALLAWKDGETIREYAAEAVLLDGDNGFPAFVRGFSFGTRAPGARQPAAEAGASSDADSETPTRNIDGQPGGEDGNDAGNDDAQTQPAADSTARAPLSNCDAVPEGVELTLGASNRQSPAFSLLSHPTNLPRWKRWALAPIVSPAVVGELAPLIEAKAPAMLVLRRVRREVDIIALDKRMAEARGLSERLPLCAELTPLAEQVDVLKSEYLANADALRELVERGTATDVGESEGQRLQGEVVDRLRRGRTLAARIEDGYWRIYDRQEAYRLSWLKKQPDMDIDVRREAEVMGEFGVRIEARLVTKDLELTELRVQGGQIADAESLLLAERKSIALERDSGISEANLVYVEDRIRTAEVDYIKQLFIEDRHIVEADILRLTGEQRLAKTLIRHLQAKRDGNFDAIEDEIAEARQRGRQEVTLGKLFKERAELMINLRHTRSDLEAELTDEERRETEERLQELEAEERVLNEKIKAAQEGLATLRGVEGE